MSNQTVADEFLVVAATILLLAEVYALRMVGVLRRRVGSGSGNYLLRVVYRFGFFVILGQSLTVLNAVLRFINSEATYDTRLMVLLVGEITLAVAFLWTVWEIHHLPADSHGENPAAPVPEPCVCVCKQINDALASTGTPVDQGHDDTPVAPV